MINATYFEYDNVFSGTYGLQIADFNVDSVEENEAFSPNLSLLKVPSLIRFFHGGVEYDSAPTATFSIISEDVIPPKMRSKILSWLIGRNEFKPLKFYNDDWKDFVYYCVFTGSSTIYVNGECHGFRVTASFDSQFARGRTNSTRFGAGTYTNQQGSIICYSDIIDNYVYPKIVFQAAASGSGVTLPSFSIKNITDDTNRACVMTDILWGEKITIDCETRVMTSSQGRTDLLEYFNRNWLRLRKGENEFRVTVNGCSFLDIFSPYYAMIGY